MSINVTTSSGERYLRETEVARILAVSLSFLHKRRADRTGPTFIKLSPAVVVYPEKGVHEWVAAQATSPDAA